MLNRLADLRRFYQLLDLLETKLDGKRTLANCDPSVVSPKRGVYFFFEPEEQRTESGGGPRVVRVGTHALTAGSKTSLWHRLSQHRGTSGSGGGNHRGSIFRLIVGSAMKHRSGNSAPESWGVGSAPGTAAATLGMERSVIRDAEKPLEQAVSRYLGAMPLLWLDVDDAPGPDSLRGVIERNSIALLSNFDRDPLDCASPKWLGHHSDRERVRKSGLWNNNHVEQAHDPAFLEALQAIIDR